MRSRTGFVAAFVFAVCAIAPGARAETPGARSDRPDIIFYLLDAARADYFGVYGQKDPTTPGIDALAKRGAVFLKHYSNSFNTRYSLSHIFLSRYEAFPILNFINDPDYSWWIRDSKLPADAALLPALLREAGYRTVVVTAHSFTGPDTELGKAFGEVVQVPPRDNQPSAPAEDVFRAARQVIDQHAKRDPSRPLFLYVHLLDTHMPHDHSAVDAGFVKGPAARWTDDEKKMRRPRMQANAYESLDPAAIELIRGEAKGAYAYLDRHLARFEADAEKRLGRSTVMILTADHGDAHGEQNFVGHNFGTFGMEELHHIPLILSGGSVPKGKQIDEYTSLVDLLPTVLDLAGGELARRQRIDGESLLPLLGGKSLHRPGVPLIFPLAWKVSRLGYREASGTYVLTERDEVYFLADGASSFESLGPKKTATLPREFSDFIRRYRQRESARRAEARGRTVNVPVTDFLVQDGSRCWSRPDWRTWQGSIRYRPASGCDPLRLAVDLPDGAYAGSWSASIEDTASGPALRIQTSASSAPVTADAADLRSGSIELGRLNVRGGRLEIWVRPLASATLELANIRLDRLDANLPEDEELSKEELDRLRSLGYIH